MKTTYIKPITRTIAIISMQLLAGSGPQATSLSNPGFKRTNSRALRGRDYDDLWDFEEDD